MKKTEQNCRGISSLAVASVAETDKNRNSEKSIFNCNTRRTRVFLSLLCVITILFSCCFSGCNSTDNKGTSSKDEQTSQSQSGQNGEFQTEQSDNSQTGPSGDSSSENESADNSVTDSEVNDTLKNYFQETSFDYIMELGSKNTHKLDGFGVQINTEYFMNFNTDFGVGEADWALFEKRVKEIKVPKFRVNIMPDYYEPVNDDNDPNHINWEGFDFESEHMKALYKILDVAQKNNVKVNITTYGAERDTWLGYPTVEDNAWWLTPPTDLEEYAESTAAVLKYLIDVKGYTCIYQYTPFNEPDFGFTKGTAQGTGRVDFELYVDFCEAIHNRLKKEGIRDKIDFNLADDATNPEWLKKVTENSVLKKIGDSFNSHVYKFDSITSDNAMLTYLSELTGYTADKPFQILEFGSGHCIDWPLTTQTDLDTYARGMMYARTAINLLNAGGVGYTHWTFFDYMREDQRMMKTGMYGMYTDNWKLRPFYHSYSLLSRYCIPDSEVYKVIEKTSDGEIIDANEKENGVSATFLKSKDGKWTQLLTNDNDYTVKIKVINHNLKNTSMKRFLYSETTLPEGDSLISQSGLVTCKNGEMIIAVPARSFILLTNIS